jgi:polysaccharide export outer membrane protein
MKPALALTTCLALALPFLFVAGCASTKPLSQGPAIPRTQHITYILQPLDSVVVQSGKGAPQTLSLDSEGKFALPDGGPTTLLTGKSTDEARKWIEAKWKGAKVVVFHQFKGERISVIGEVQRPANLPLADTPMSLLDALAAAGGLTSLADPTAVSIVRQDADLVTVYKIDAYAIMHGRNVEQNIPVESGDVITVPRAFF